MLGRCGNVWNGESETKKEKQSLHAGEEGVTRQRLVTCWETLTIKRLKDTQYIKDGGSQIPHYERTALQKQERNS